MSDHAEGSLEFAELYKSQQSLVRSVIYQIAGPSVLDDLVQEAFVRIWRGLPEFRNESRLSSWIYRVSVNTALDHLRSRARRPEDSTEDLSHIEDPSLGADSHLANREIVELGLSKLTEDHRTVLVLALMHERPLGEIADILEISEGTVKSRLHYAKNEFRIFLENKGIKL